VWRNFSYIEKCENFFLDIVHIEDQTYNMLVRIIFAENFINVHLEFWKHYLNKLVKASAYLDFPIKEDRLNSMIMGVSHHMIIKPPYYIDILSESCSL
jgi:hypothetical protein